MVQALSHIVEGCNCCNVGKDHTIAMSSYSKSKDDMQCSSESEDESGNIDSSNGQKRKRKTNKMDCESNGL